MIPATKSSLDDIFVKETNIGKALLMKSQKRNLGKIKQKVSSINASIKNPIEMYLPPQLRTIKSESDEEIFSKWNLLKSDS